MVPHTGAPSGPARIRSLNKPRLVQVESDKNSRPSTVHLSGRPCAVEAVLESWRIDDEWWRNHPLSRIYWRVLLEDGRVLDVYRDLMTGCWAKQSY